jgi:hypothetical protein
VAAASRRCGSVLRRANSGGTPLPLFMYSYFGDTTLVVFAVVTGLVIWFPKNLLFGKEEHSKPELEKTALRDQIEDLIHANVKQECLQKAEKRGN